MKALYLFIFFLLSVFLLLSCTQIKEKKEYDRLYNQHHSTECKPDSLLFGLVVGEPKDVSMAKLYVKGLYSEGGYGRYNIPSNSEIISNLFWKLSLKFRNDSLMGIYLHTEIPDDKYKEALNSLFDLYVTKYKKTCFYDEKLYLFFGNSYISVYGYPSSYDKNSSFLTIDYEKVNWFFDQSFPVHTEKDKYGNELWNYYSGPAKEEPCKSYKDDPALNEI